MKTFLTSFIIFFLSMQLWAQSANYFNDLTRWKEFFHTAEPYGEYFHNYTSVKRIQGDTTIGSFQYKKVYSKKLRYDYYIPSNPSNPNYNYVGGTTIYNDSLYAFIRQDLLEVYYNVNGVDSLLYDFDIQVGDTITRENVTLLNDYEAFKVDSITDFYVQNELRHIFHVHSLNSWSWFDHSYSYLIEGIGTYGGLLAPLSFDFEWDSYDLSCYSIDNVNFFNTLNDNSTIQNCSYNLAVNKLVNEFDFSVSPNPTSKILELTIPIEIDIQDLILTDLSGRTFNLDYNQVGEKITVDIEKFQSGIYILRLKTELNQMVESKITKI